MHVPQKSLPPGHQPPWDSKGHRCGHHLANHLWPPHEVVDDQANAPGVPQDWQPLTANTAQDPDPKVELGSERLIYETYETYETFRFLTFHAFACPAAVAEQATNWRGCVCVPSSTSRLNLQIDFAEEPWVMAVMAIIFPTPECLRMTLQTFAPKAPL